MHLGRLAKSLWYVLSLKCDEADRIACTERSGAELTKLERVGESLHRVACRSCRKAKAQLAVLEDALWDLQRRPDDAMATEGGTLSSAARQRLEQALTQARTHPPSN